MTDIKVNGTKSIGGLVGNSTGEIKNSEVVGTIIGVENVGGCIGELSSWNKTLKCDNNKSNGTIE